MVELLTQMSALGGFTSILLILGFIYAIKEGHNLLKQGIGIFNEYHQKEQKKTDQETLLVNLSSTVALLTSRIEELESQVRDDKFIERIPKLENAMIEKDNKIELILAELNSVNKSLRDAEKERRDNTLNTSRSAMYRLQLEAKTNNQVTQASLENFLNLADTYLNMGGNSYYKQVVIPSYLEFPVKDIEGTHSLPETNTKLRSVKEKLDG